MRRALLFFVILLVAFSGRSFADPAALMGNIKGVDLPSQTIEIPAVDGGSLGDNTVRHCYVFPVFAAIETSSGQIGADSIVMRKRADGQSDAELCRVVHQAGDRFVEGADGYVLGARGPFLFVTAADSSGSQDALTIFQISSGKKLLDVDRNVKKPFVARFDEGVLSLHFFVALSLDCDLAVESCWAETLQKNHVPSEAVIVRPQCDGRSANPKAVQISASVIVPDVAHPKLAYENGQPPCDAN